MVDTLIKLLNSGRTKGLSFLVAHKNLFLAKVVPRFTYAFSLLRLTKWGSVHDLIRKTLERALCCTFGWSVPKRLRVQPGVWFIVCGFSTVFALLRKLKLEMAARLKVGDRYCGVYTCPAGVRLKKMFIWRWKIGYYLGFGILWTQKL